MAFTYFLILWSTAWSPSRLCKGKDRKQAALAGTAKHGHSSPSPAAPGGGCSALQMCWAAAKLPGLGKELEASRGHQNLSVQPGVGQAYSPHGSGCQAGLQLPTEPGLER